MKSANSQQQNQCQQSPTRVETMPMEIPISDQVTRDLGYDSDLIMNEKDRMFLMSMAEIDREQELHKRRLNRQELKKKYEFRNKMSDYKDLSQNMQSNKLADKLVGSSDSSDHHDGKSSDSSNSSSESSDFSNNKLNTIEKTQSVISK